MECNFRHSEWHFSFILICILHALSSPFSYAMLFNFIRSTSLKVKSGVKPSDFINCIFLNQLKKWLRPAMIWFCTKFHRMRKEFYGLKREIGEQTKTWLELERVRCHINCCEFPKFSRIVWTRMLELNHILVMCAKSRLHIHSTWLRVAKTMHERKIACLWSVWL